MNERFDAWFQHAMLGLTVRRAIVVIVTIAIVLSVVAALLERLVDPAFRTTGLAFWWAITTVTTVGYGDVVPTNTAGRIVASVLMLMGISLVPLITSAVVSVLISQATKESNEQEAANIARIMERLDSIDRRLGTLEAER
ncbi:MAG TPA: potassium channel family protein [Gaiellaceae bacterium]|jgi:voltage-gated potassium channel